MRTAFVRLVQHTLRDCPFTDVKSYSPRYKECQYKKQYQHKIHFVLNIYTNTQRLRIKSSPQQSAKHSTRKKSDALFLYIKQLPQITFRNSHVFLNSPKTHFSLFCPSCFKFSYDIRNLQLSRKYNKQKQNVTQNHLNLIYRDCPQIQFSSKSYKITPQCRLFQHPAYGADSCTSPHGAICF